MRSNGLKCREELVPYWDFDFADSEKLTLNNDAQDQNEIQLAK